MHDDPGIVCRDCGHENPEGSRFCGLCGASLAAESSCSACGGMVPPGFRFCNQCGTPVGAPAPGAGEAPPDHTWKIDAGRESAEGERKQISVLFADVKGSMDLAERLDPESWSELMSRLFRVLADAVHQADGTVDKFTGDGIMALFGAPIAREDHAQCACRAALAMMDGVAALAEEVSGAGLALAVRVGINSGEVVVGSIGDQGEMEYTAVGHTVGLAQRMESLAETGSAYLTERTASLVEGYFEVTPVGERQVKGASIPLAVFRLDRAGAAHGRFDVARSRGLSTFVGRAAEVSELEAALERSLSGTGEVVGVVAAAGVGKSRLCHEFVARCRERGIPVYRAQCQSHTKAVPLVPVLELLRDRFGIAPTDSDAEARAKVGAELAEMGVGPGMAEDVAILLDFLGVPDPAAPGIQMKGDARNRRLRDMVRGLVQATSRDPSVVLIEDLHWIDPASEVFLETLVETIPSSRGIVVTNFRPEYRAPWMSGAHYRQLPLSPLPQDSLHALLHELLGADASLDGLADLISERTGGNPFYVEEIVRELAESGTLTGARGSYRMAREIDGLPVPSTIQAILAARIDRLPSEAKVTLQTAAAVGSEVSRRLLHEVVDLDDDALDLALRALIEAEFVREAAVYPEQVFAFRHPLTQEVAYGSQLARARARAHTAVALGLQATDPDRVDENAGLIAHHFERAGDGMQAAQWHLRAIGWSGLRDPMSSIRHALQIVDLEPILPRDAEGDGVRLIARLYLTTMGWRVGADPAATRRAYEEGLVIAERSGNETFLALLHGSFAASALTCERRAAESYEIGMKAVALADSVGDPGLRALVMGYPCYLLWLRGQLADSVGMADLILDLTADDPEIPFRDLIGSPRIWAMTARAPSLMAMGRAEEARRSIDEAIDLATAIGDQETLGWAHMFASTFHLMGHPTPVEELLAHTRASMEIADRLGDAFSRTWARFWHSYGSFAAGDLETAIAGFARNLTEIDDSGAGRESEPLIRCKMGDALVASGRVEEGIAECRRAVAVGEGLGLALNRLWTRESLARALLARGADGDAQAAADELRVALASAEESGNVIAQERVTLLLDRLSATPSG